MGGWGVYVCSVDREDGGMGDKIKKVARGRVEGEEVARRRVEGNEFVIEEWKENER